MKRKPKLPAEVESVLKFVSENQKSSGFSGKITPEAVKHAMQLHRQGKLKRKAPLLRRQRPLSECIETVDAPEGKDRVKKYLETQPYPHYEQAKEAPGLLVRIEANGKRTIGRFVNRKFRPVEAALPRRQKPQSKLTTTG